MSQKSESVGFFVYQELGRHPQDLAEPEPAWTKTFQNWPGLKQLQDDWHEHFTYDRKKTKTNAG